MDEDMLEVQTNKKLFKETKKIIDFYTSKIFHKLTIKGFQKCLKEFLDLKKKRSGFKRLKTIKLKK